MSGRLRSAGAALAAGLIAGALLAAGGPPALASGDVSPAAVDPPALASGDATGAAAHLALAAGRADRAAGGAGHGSRALGVTRRARTASRRSVFEASELGAALSPTPYMGWDTYFSFGSNFDESSVLEQASEMVQLRLPKLGYRYVWLDAGWWQGKRTKQGKISVSHAQWPRGIAALAETLHDAGLKLGVYTDAGHEGCGNGTAGSYHHYSEDVNTLAAWGVDAVKVDFCGGSQQRLNPKRTYARFHQAIVHDRPHRPILLSVCDYLQPGILGKGRPPVSESSWTSYTFGPEVGNSWRTETDVGVPGSITFTNMLRNLDSDATHPEAAGPGHWNDPDYLAPGQGMSAAQFRTQFSMWAMLAAPLMVSEDLYEISHRNLETIENPEVIAVDQDPAGVQGTLVASSGEGEVWAKPLSDGSFAVALLNRGASRIQIATSAEAIGLRSAKSYSVRNLWTHRQSSTSGALSASVPAYSTVLLRVSARS